MAICDLPNMYALRPRVSGIHIRQIPHGHVTTITYFTAQVLSCTKLTWVSKGQNSSQIAQNRNISMNQGKQLRTRFRTTLLML